MEENKEIKKEEDIDLDPDKKPVREPVFGVHKMPKGYKTGRFGMFSEEKNISHKESSASFLNEKNKEQKKHKGKKLGFLIILFGVIFIAFIVYFIFSYLNNPGERVFKFPSFNFSRESKDAEIDKDDSTKNSVDLINVEDVDDLEEFEIIENIFDDSFQTGDETETEDYFFDVDEEFQFEEGESTDDASSGSDDFNDIPMFDSFVDTDGDGLSDEEEALLGTSPINTDTDGDGYDDLTELLNLYNPAGTGDILSNSNISEYKNNIFSYSIYYPVSWELKTLSDGSSVIFLIDDSSFVQALVEKNEGRREIKDWYSSRFSQVANTSSLIKKNSFDGIFSSDFNSFYATDKNKQNVYSIIYSIPENTIANYYNIFRMMVNSFYLN